MAKQSEATLLLRIKSSGDEVLSKTGDALKKLGEIAAAAYATANAAAAAAIHAYREQEQATNSLNQALINQGIYSKDLSASYQKVATELQKTTTFADEAIIAAQAQIQQYIGQEKITKDLTKATLDFATAMGMDLESASQIIGKSIGSNTNMLMRYGIAVDENATKSEKMAFVTQQLERRFGGQADAAAQGLGSLKMMANAMGEVMEVAGEKLAPVVIYAAKAVTTFANELQTNQIMISNFQDAAILLGKAGVLLKNIIMGLGETIGQVFGTIAGAAIQLANAQFKAAFETIKSGFSGTAGTITDRYETFQQELSSIDKVYANQKRSEDEAEIKRIEATAQAKAAIENNLILTQEQMFAARDQKDIQRLLDQENLKKDQHLRELNNAIVREQNHTQKLNLEKQKREYLDDQYSDAERKRIFDLTDFKNQMNTKAMGEFEGVLSNMSAMQNSKSKILVGIGKAAAMAQMAISTARGAVDAFAFGASLGGPVAGMALAAPIIAYGVERQASIAGIELAEGGVVKATPGGVHAVIGEAGQDEMVIPLDKGSSPNIGTRINIQVYGGFLGSDAQAKEFAIVLDKELLKLRQSNESLAFDKGII